MKNKLAISVLFGTLLFSCDGPETTVTNLVNPDGSILRKVEMKYTKKDFNPRNYRVPVDSTWTIRDSLTISAKGDTTWYILADKVFSCADAISEEYLTDSGVNRKAPRKAFFERRFKWFTTTYYFSETCSFSLDNGYPIENFLSEDEIAFIKMPLKVKSELYAGSDSTLWFAKRDTIDSKSEEWQIKSIISQWIEEAGKLCESSGKDSLTTAMLRSHENEIFELTVREDDLSAGLKTVLGNRIYKSFHNELDSAIQITDSIFDRSLSLQAYTMQIVMPGKLKSHNGYLSPDGVIAWNVTGDLFLTADYLMYAESEEINHRVIIISIMAVAAFLMLICFRGKRKKP